jgi:hypothetical protein
MSQSDLGTRLTITQVVGDDATIQVEARPSSWPGYVAVYAHSPETGFQDVVSLYITDAQASVLRDALTAALDANAVSA